MQSYPQVPVTDETKVMYVPVYQPSIQHQQYPPMPPTYQPETPVVSESVKVPHNDVPFFERFWVTENGVISISVRNMTVIACLLMTLSLAANLYVACETAFECKTTNFPTISKVVGLPIWDRLACLTTTFYCMGAHQIAIRCFYKKLYGKASHQSNDWLLILGIVTTISAPLTAYFDIYDHADIHTPLSYLFFGSMSGYALILAQQLKKHKESFPKGSHPEINRTALIANLITASLAALGFFQFYDDRYVPICQWVCAALIINFFAFSIYTNEYYESIHPPTHFHQMSCEEWEIHQ